MTDTHIHTLSNGCKVLYRPTPDKQVLSIVAAARRGARDDEPDQAGLTGLMTRLLTKGAGGRSSFQIAETLESVGGSIDPFCGQDFLGLETQSVAEDWRVALEILTDCLFAPAFDADEFQKERAVLQAEICRLEDDKFSYTYQKFLELFYRGHPYGLSADGYVETVGALEVADATRSHALAARPEQITIVVVGNAPEEELLAEIEKRWPAASAPDAHAPAMRRRPTRPPGDGMGETLVMSKEAEQAFVVQGYPAPLAGSQECAALRLACGVLGEGMSSRLFARLRDRDHLAYAVGGSLVCRELGSHLMLYIGTGPDKVRAAREGLSREVASMLSEPPDSDEVERARRYILGKYLIGRQTNSALAHSMLAGELMDLGWEWSEGFPDRLRAVTDEMALEVVRKWMQTPAVALLQPTDEA